MLLPITNLSVTQALYMKLPVIVFAQLELDQDPHHESFSVGSVLIGGGVGGESSTAGALVTGQSPPGSPAPSLPFIIPARSSSFPFIFYPSSLKEYIYVSRETNIEYVMTLNNERKCHKAAKFCHSGGAESIPLGGRPIP